MSRHSASRALALAGVALAAALAGCGKTGELQRPPPLFGRAKATTPEDSAQRQDAARPVRTIDPRTQHLDPSPNRVNPLPGQSPDPTAPGPQGAMSSPYATPQ